MLLGTLQIRHKIEELYQVAKEKFEEKKLTLIIDTRESDPLFVNDDIPFIRKKLNRIAGKKLIETFGGKIRFFGLAGQHSLQL